MSDAAEIIQQEFATTAGTYKKREIAISHGDGVWIYDVDGNKYFDGIAGIGANVLGHNHPSFVAALTDQISKTVSVPELMVSDVRSSYQAKLLSMFPEQYGRVFLCNGGAEANEAALKFARVISGRSHLVSTVFGYHGKTLGALSVTHNPKYREPFEPLYHPVSYLPAGSGADIAKYDEAVKEHGEPAAFIFEAIQGEGGVKHQEAEFIRQVAERVQSSGGFVVADEVQCGAGRTGEWAAYAELGVQPDFVVLGKGIGNGVPLSAVVMNDRVTDLPPLAHTTTFGGNPLSCRAGIAVLDAIEKDSLLKNVQAQGEYFRSRIADAGISTIREVRGRGLMIGIELKQKAGPYLKPLQDKGVLALLAGPRVLRILPSYVITREEVDFVADAFCEVLTQ